MEKLLVCGDTHGDTNHVRHLLAVGRRFGCPAIFILGDTGAWEHTPEGVKFFDAIDKAAHREKVEIFFIDGNHDKTSLLLSKYSDRDEEGFLTVREHVYYAPRGHRWMWAGTRFAAFGGAYSTDKQWRIGEEVRRRKPESLWFPEEEMTDEDMATFLLDTTPVDIILAHDKPRASNPAWNRKDILECYPNQDRLQMAVYALNPCLFLHGHLHHRYTDHIRSDFSNENAWCQVEGLTCDPRAGMYEPGYDRADSRVILHIVEKRIEKVP